MKNVVVFGGGNGLSTFLKGIKSIKDINIKAVVTVADSGGSTGEIRKFYKSPALGDLRRVLVALSKKENVLSNLMNYRFSSNNENDPLNNHSLGNLIMLAINDMNGFYDGVKYLSNIFNVVGEVIPLTDNVSCELKAEYQDGSIEISEHKIPNSNKRIKNISYENENEIKVNPRVIEVIDDADLIVFSFGSLYTSIIASIALPEVKEALLNNKDKEFAYICNIMTQPGETQNMDAYDHAKAIELCVGSKIIDYIILNNDSPTDSKLIKKYNDVGAELILKNEKLEKSHYNLIECSLIDSDVKDVIRHDSKKIEKAFKTLLKKIGD